MGSLGRRMVLARGKYTRKPPAVNATAGGSVPRCGRPVLRDLSAEGAVQVSSVVPDGTGVMTRLGSQDRGPGLLSFGPYGTSRGSQDRGPGLLSFGPYGTKVLGDYRSVPTGRARLPRTEVLGYYRSVPTGRVRR